MGVRYIQSWSISPAAWVMSRYHTLTRERKRVTPTVRRISMRRMGRAYRRSQVTPTRKWTIMTTRKKRAMRKSSAEAATAARGRTSLGKLDPGHQVRLTRQARYPRRDGRAEQRPGEEAGHEKEGVGEPAARDPGDHGEDEGKDHDGRQGFEERPGDPQEGLPIAGGDLPADHPGQQLAVTDKDEKMPGEVQVFAKRHGEHSLGSGGRAASRSSDSPCRFRRR